MSVHRESGSWIAYTIIKASGRGRMSGSHVLIVEDDDLISEGLEAILSMEGMEVSIARNGREASARTGGPQPHVIVLDMMLPDTRGIVLFDTFRRSWPEVPIVFSSGNADEGEIGRRLDDPRVRHLRKPYDTQDLIDAITELTAE